MSNINTLVVSALNTAAAFQQRVEALRAACPRELLTDKAALADALRPGVAKFYGIQLELKSTGRAVFPSEHDKTNMAKLSLSRLVRAVIGQTSNHAADKPKVRVASFERAAYTALLDACGGDLSRVRAVVKALGAA